VQIKSPVIIKREINMNIIKNTSITINILFILIIIGLITYINIINKTISTESKVKNSVTICTKTIQDEQNVKTYITENIYYDDNLAITSESSKVIYDINDDITYQSIKSKLSNCNDNYEEDKKITCEVELNDDVKKIFGTWAYRYIEGAKSDGFICEKG
jgi:hypothetical protein